MDIERLEKEVVEMRSDVKARDAATATSKAARHAHVSSLEAVAAAMEAQLVDTAANSVRMMEEVKAMFPVIDFIFYAIGSDKAFDVPAPASPGKAGAAGHGGGHASSPLRVKTAALKMYTGNPAMKADVQAGVTAGSLSQFMGIAENRAADIIQQYAAVASGGAGVPAALPRSPSPGAPDGADAGGLRLALGGTSDARRALSPAALGPSRPTGRLKESLTSSSLVAALAVDAAKMEAPDGDRDDDARPISLDELKRQAARQMEADKNFKAVRSAALQAATVLTRGGLA